MAVVRRPSKYPILNQKWQQLVDLSDKFPSKYPILNADVNTLVPSVACYVDAGVATHFS